MPEFGPDHKLSPEERLARRLNPTLPYKLVAVSGAAQQGEMVLACACGNLITRRRDAFLPGTHVVICLKCHNVSTEVQFLDGHTVAVTAESHQGGGS